MAILSSIYCGKKADTFSPMATTLVTLFCFKSEAIVSYNSSSVFPLSIKSDKITFLFCPVFCCCSLSVPRGSVASPRAGRGAHTALYRARVYALLGLGDDPAGLGAGRSGRTRARDCPHPAGRERLSGHGRRVEAAILACSVS